MFYVVVIFITYDFTNKYRLNNKIVCKNKQN